MNKETLIKSLIDSRNESLWKTIEENFSVSFIATSNKEYGCYTQSKNVIFYVDENNLCKDSFTHEMLHVHLRLKDCFIGAGLKNTINGNRILSSTLTPALIEHMGNCLDHIKMLPIYLAMDFDKRLFIIDYEVNKCPQDCIRLLINNYSVGGKINPDAADLFIGKLFAIKADPNDDFDYTHQLEQLEKIDSLLFNINIDMIASWKQIKIENKGTFDENYHSVLFKYYNNLERWISNKHFS